MRLNAQRSTPSCVWNSESIQYDINMKGNLFPSRKEKLQHAAFFKKFPSKSTQRSGSQIRYPSWTLNSLQYQRPLIDSPHPETMSPSKVDLLHDAASAWDVGWWESCWCLRSVPRGGFSPLALSLPLSLHPLCIVFLFFSAFWLNGVRAEARVPICRPMVP